MPVSDANRALALRNITEFGDTDIFPYPLENRIFFDKQAEVTNLLEDMDKKFQEFLSDNPPANVSALSPVGYTGYRWATQLDPLWNAFFLAQVIEAAPSIEADRLSVSDEAIFSYRFKPDAISGGLYDPSIGWQEFMGRSKVLAEQFDWVVMCDIADFYPRAYHHRIENALNYAKVPSDISQKILSLLQNFSHSGNVSYGLPVGGPASRLLAELLLSATDKYLISGCSLPFCRFVDDFHVYTKSREDAHKALVNIAEYLLKNEGLPLQKTKSRILRSSEFLTTSNFFNPDTPRPEMAQLLKLNLRYDPYSSTAEEDYENLKAELSKLDVVSLLATELEKSRVHSPVTKQLIRAIKFLDPWKKIQAIESLIANIDNLAPVFGIVMLTLMEVMDELTPPAKEKISETLRSLILSGSHLAQVAVNLSYMVRVLARHQSRESERLFSILYSRSDINGAIKRDIVLAMARWQATWWLTNLRGSFTSMHSWERRAFIVASYALGDEGDHWRRHAKRHFTPFEVIVRDWGAKFASTRPLQELPL